MAGVKRNQWKEVEERVLTTPDRFPEVKDRLHVKENAAELYSHDYKGQPSRRQNDPCAEIPGLYALNRCYRPVCWHSRCQSQA